MKKGERGGTDDESQDEQGTPEDPTPPTGLALLGERRTLGWVGCAGGKRRPAPGVVQLVRSSCWEVEARGRGRKAAPGFQAGGRKGRSVTRRADALGEDI